MVRSKTKMSEGKTGYFAQGADGGSASLPTYARKIWVLISPEGEKMEVPSLARFIRERPEIFPKYTTAVMAFQTIRKTLFEEGYAGRKICEYEGWTLGAPPTPIADKVCTQCGAPHKAKGLCRNCYERKWHTKNAKKQKPRQKSREKTWYLISPEGEKMEVPDLAKFLREREGEFGRLLTAINAFQCIRGTKYDAGYSGPRRDMYMGWTLYAPPSEIEKKCVQCGGSYHAKGLCYTCYVKQREASRGIKRNHVPEGYFSVKDFAALHGVSPYTVYKDIKQGHIPCTRVGKRAYIQKDVTRPTRKVTQNRAIKNDDGCSVCGRKIFAGGLCKECYHSFN